YYRAFSTLDAGAITPYFHEPAMIRARAGIFIANTSADIKNFFGRSIEDLRKRGYGRSEFSLTEIKLLGDSGAFVAGVAIRIKTSGEELERVPITYMVHKNDAGWKIALVALP